MRRPSWRRGSDWLHARHVLEARYLRVVKRNPRRDELDGLTAFACYLAAVERREGPSILRSVPQIAKVVAPALGWRRADGVKHAHHLYGNRFKRMLRRLEQLGYVERWEPAYASNGEGRGRLIVLAPAIRDVASAAKPTRLRRSGAPEAPQATSRRGGRSRPSSASQNDGSVGPPTGSPHLRSSGEEITAAGARCAPQRRAPASGWRDCLAALEGHREQIDEGGGRRAVAELPWIAACPPLELARALLVLLCPTASPVISAKRQEQLEAAVRRLDRYGEPGLGRQKLIDVIRGGALSQTRGQYRALLSLGGVAIRLRRIANRKRRDALEARRKEGNP